MEERPSIEVLKLDLDGQLNWSYSGRLLERGKHHLTLEAFFDKEDFVLLDVLWKKGDRFVETFYDNRGYNVFEMHDRDTGLLKGWYCNLSRFAEITGHKVAWVDLALDLWVWPDGRRAILDRDEFADLSLDPVERANVEKTLLQLEQAFEEHRPPR